MLRTPLCDLLGIEYPIMLAGMGGVSYSAVTAAVSAAGGFGCLGAAIMHHDEMKREAEFLRARGTVARYTVEKGQPHRIETLAGVNASRLFDGFEETKKGCSR